MSWQCMEAVRDHSESTGTTRAIGYTLASYADRDGDGIYPGLKAIMAGANCSRKTAIDGRRWFIESGEAVVVRGRPSRTGTPIPELSFRPLLLKGSNPEPLDEGKGSEIAPFGDEGCKEDTLEGSEIAPSRVQFETAKGSDPEPKPEGTVRDEPEDEPEDARGGARDAGPQSGLSPSSSGPSGLTPAQAAAELREIREQLVASIRPGAATEAGARRRIETIDSELAELGLAA